MNIDMTPEVRAAYIADLCHEANREGVPFLTLIHDQTGWERGVILYAITDARRSGFMTGPLHTKMNNMNAPVTVEQREDTPPMLSSRELAQALGVTSATVRRWVRTNKLKPTSITYGGYYQFSLEDARGQLEAQRFVRNRGDQDAA